MKDSHRNHSVQFVITAAAITQGWAHFYVSCIKIYVSGAVKIRECVSLISSFPVSGLSVDIFVFQFLVLIQMASRVLLTSDKIH
jgi:hypothetical protein